MEKTIFRTVRLAAVCWILLIGMSAAWNWIQVDRSLMKLAESEARSSYNKDTIYRRWVAMHGGVYVPPTKATPPNPHLANLPDRDIITVEGKRLTLINPAYMTRQVHELGKELYGLRGHITSLNPLRPENAPDAGEARALRAFETGENEVMSVELLDGRPYFRYMRPFITEEACLKCHGHQGYATGDIRGGISISTPLAAYSTAADEQRIPLVVAHGLIGLFGLLGLFAGGTILRRSGQRERENETILKIAGELAQLGGWRVDLPGDRVKWSDQVAAIHEMPPGFSPTVKEGIAFYAPEYREKIAWVFAACAKEGIPYDEEMQIVTATGRRVWVRVIGRAQRNHAGDIIAVNGGFQDVTERKRIEADRELLIAAVEQGSEMIIITDADAVIQYVNPAFETVSGYSRREVLGQNPRMFSSGKQDRPFYRDMWDTLTHGNTFHGRMINKRKDGSLYTEDASISPVRDAGGDIVNYVAVKRDVTAHIQLEEQLQQSQKLESIGRLAGGVAHDYNNMLSVILGYAEMALDQVNPSDPLHADLEEIYNAGRRSMNITSQLLTFARKQIIVPKILDLNETVEGMLKMLRRLIGEDIHIEWHPEAGLWPVKIDPVQVDQILANLCVNARDAIDGVGKITIETTNTTLDPDYCENHAGFRTGDFVVLTVSDNGRGMDKTILANLFEPFFTTKETGKGTGLGLATVYGIIKQNHGFINVYSEPGQGSAFRIYLPRHAGETPDAPSDAADEIPFGMGEIVLLVEDEPHIIRMGKMMLEKLGYQVLTAETPSKAVDLAREHAGKIDLLITDVIMPEINGRELAREISHLCPKAGVLFMSGYTAEVIAHHGVLDPGVVFMQKPFNSRTLAGKVKEALDKNKVHASQTV